MLSDSPLRSLGECESHRFGRALAGGIGGFVRGFYGGMLGDDAKLPAQETPSED